MNKSQQNNTRIKRQSTAQVSTPYVIDSTDSSQIKKGRPRKATPRKIRKSTEVMDINDAPMSIDVSIQLPSNHESGLSDNEMIGLNGENEISLEQSHSEVPVFIQECLLSQTSSQESEFELERTSEGILVEEVATSDQPVSEASECEWNEQMVTSSSENEHAIINRSHATILSATDIKTRKENVFDLPCSSDDFTEPEYMSVRDKNEVNVSTDQTPYHLVNNHSDVVVKDDTSITVIDGTDKVESTTSKCAVTKISTESPDAYEKFKNKIKKRGRNKRRLTDDKEVVVLIHELLKKKKKKSRFTHRSSAAKMGTWTITEKPRKIKQEDEKQSSDNIVASVVGNVKQVGDENSTNICVPLDASVQEADNGVVANHVVLGSIIPNENAQACQVSETESAINVQRTVSPEKEIGRMIDKVLFKSIEKEMFKQTVLEDNSENLSKKGNSNISGNTSKDILKKDITNQIIIDNKETTEDVLNLPHDTPAVDKEALVRKTVDLSQDGQGMICYKDDLKLSVCLPEKASVAEVHHDMDVNEGTPLHCISKQKVISEIKTENTREVGLSSPLNRCDKAEYNGGKLSVHEALSNKKLETKFIDKLDNEEQTCSAIKIESSVDDQLYNGLEVSNIISPIKRKDENGETREASRIRQTRSKNETTQQEKTDSESLQKELLTGFTAAKVEDVQILAKELAVEEHSQRTRCIRPDSQRVAITEAGDRSVTDAEEDAGQELEIFLSKTEIQKEKIVGENGSGIVEKGDVSEKLSREEDEDEFIDEDIQKIKPVQTAFPNKNKRYKNTSRNRSNNVTLLEQQQIKAESLHAKSRMKAKNKGSQERDFATVDKSKRKRQTRSAAKVDVMADQGKTSITDINDKTGKISSSEGNSGFNVQEKLSFERRCTTEGREIVIITN